nr:tRNA glutamyl-Q(34) synthetase GluQRS [Alkalilimnicola ehrlichii]
MTQAPERLCRTRFAPSPTGPLHFGSLVAALGSYVHAHRKGGEWHLRIDDLDPPREQPGAADAIRRSLEAHALCWDGPVVFQSRRSSAYEAALARLRAAGQAYPCGCTRREIMAVARRGPNGPIYPGTCARGLPAGRTPRAWRLRCGHAPLRFEDALQGPIQCDPAATVGDFIIRRADGLWAYHLACAVDDGEFGFTDIVRGADLLWCTPPQILIQRALDLPTPRYRHLPIVVNAQGQKLSKQTHAPALNDADATGNLLRAARFLGQSPPAALRHAPPQTVLDWALAHWDDTRVPQVGSPTPASPLP